MSYCKKRDFYIMNNNHNPYSTPKANSEKMSYYSDQDNVALWNPSAACNWCLLFSPIFGAYLQMLNWRALGEDEKAQGSFVWFIGCIICLLVSIFADVNLMFGLLIAWYFISGRSQVKYVKEHFGDNYERKSWGIPLLCGVGIYVAAFVLIFVYVLIFE